MFLELKIRTHRITGHRKNIRTQKKNRTHRINSALEMLISIWTHNYNVKCRLILWKIQSEILNYTKWYSWMIVKRNCTCKLSEMIILSTKYLIVIMLGSFPWTCSKCTLRGNPYPGLSCYAHEIALGWGARCITSGKTRQVSDGATWNSCDPNQTLWALF